MLTNQDRREILNQVKASGSGDIMSALRGNISTAPQQASIPTPDPVTIPESPQSIDLDLQPAPSLPSNLVDSTTAMPTQLAQTGGFNNSYTPKFPVPEKRESKIYETQDKPILDKIVNVLANPLAAFGRSIRGENVNPGNIPRGENPFDAFVLGMVNPASWVESGQYAVKEAKQGNYVASGLNALGFLPVFPAAKAFAKTTAKTAKNVPKPTGMLKTGPEEVVRPPLLSEVDKLKIAKIKDTNIKRIQSDEYVSKRSANTGESKESIISQVNEYIDELNKAPMRFKAVGDPSMSNVLGYYRPPLSLQSKFGEIAIKRGLQKDLTPRTFGTIDHEIKHLLSPTGKFDKSHPLYKEALEEIKQINFVNAKLARAKTPREADKAVEMYANIRSISAPRMDQKVYKNYPVLDIKREMPTKDFEYFIDPAEQQVRLLRGAEWFKRNYNWDGTKAGMTDDMLKEVFEQMSGKSPSKQMLPTDFRQLLANSQNTTYSTLRDVISKAWAAAPVAIGAGSANKKKHGGLHAPWELKKGIRQVESSDGINMMSNTSTATGLYGQLYSEVENLPMLEDISREQFASDTTLQNQIFDMRYRGDLPGVPGLTSNIKKLRKDYSTLTGNYTDNELAALSNYTGREGARKYFASIRDGIPFKLPGNNIPVEEYMQKYRDAVKNR